MNDIDISKEFHKNIYKVICKRIKEKHQDRHPEQWVQAKFSIVLKDNGNVLIWRTIYMHQMEVPLADPDLVDKLINFIYNKM